MESPNVVHVTRKKQYSNQEMPIMDVIKGYIEFTPRYSAVSITRGGPNFFPVGIFSLKNIVNFRP